MEEDMAYDLTKYIAVLEDPETTRDDFDEAVRRMAVLSQE